MLEHVINSIPIYFRSVSVGVPAWWNVPIIQETYGREINFVKVKDTKGPAHTALQVLEDGIIDHSLILDVDVINFTNDLSRLTLMGRIGVLVSQSANPAFSYVDSLGFFNQILEKQRISEFAVRGAYFIHKYAMPDFMEKLEETISTESEPYLSQVFNRYQGQKFSILTAYTPVDWGTPEDVKLSGARITSREE
jgi:hypothetical protein